MLAVVNGFAGLGINDIPSRLQGLGYLGLGTSLADPSTIASEILHDIAAGSTMIEGGAIWRGNFRNNPKYRGATGIYSIGGTIETQLYGMFQGGAWKSFIDPNKCETRYRPVNNEPYRVCGVDAMTQNGNEYYNAWLQFLQSPAAMAKAIELVTWKQKTLATPVTDATIAASEAEWTKRLAEHMATVKSQETSAIQAIRDAQAIPLNYAQPTPMGIQAGSPDRGERAVTTTTTPSVIVPVPEPTVMQGSPSPSGAVWPTGGSVSMQANDLLDKFPGPSTEVGGFNIPWLLLGGVGLVLYMTMGKKGR